MEERIVKRLMTTVKCTHCGQGYQQPNVTILGHDRDLYFIKAYCATCRTQFLIAASVTAEKTTVILSDLSSDEATRFKKSPPPSADDVLDMHGFLKTFSGDFLRLFGRERVS